MLHFKDVQDTNINKNKALALFEIIWFFLFAPKIKLVWT